MIIIATNKLTEYPLTKSHQVASNQSGVKISCQALLGDVTALHAVLGEIS